MRVLVSGLRSVLRRFACALVAGSLVVPGLGTTAAAAGPAETTLTGTLRAVIADDFEHGRTETRYAIETPEGRVSLVVDGGGVPELSGGRVTVSGTRLANGSVRVAALRPATGSAPEGAAAPAAGAVYGWPGPAVRRVLVVIGTYTDRVTPPVASASLAEEALRDHVPSVTTFFETASRGRVTIEATVLGPLALGIDSCPAYDSFDDTRVAVEAKAAASGISVAAYDHVIAWTPAPCGTSWTALGEAPGRFIQVSAPYPDDGGRTDEFANVASHEMGHNMGLLHANGLACENAGGTPVALSGSCEAVEYGDPFSTMGGDQGWADPIDGPHFLNPLYDSAELAHLGWLDPAEEQTVTAAGSYDLVPTYAPGPGVRLLRIRRTVGPVSMDPSMGYPIAHGWLTVELRSEPPGAAWDTFGTSSPARTGVIIRFVGDGYDPTTVGYLPALGSSYLVDTDPATVGVNMWDDELHDAPLQVGDTFTDSVKGTQITLTSLDAGGATVSIAFPSGDPPAAPAIAPPVVTSAIAGDGQATVTWSTPATSGTFGVEGYTVRSHPGGEACVTFAGMGNTCTVTGLANGTPYRFTVTSETTGGAWQMSAPSAEVTPNGPPVARITPLAAFRASQSISVAWSGLDDGGSVDSFDVRYRSAPWNGSYGALTTWGSSTTATSATLTGSPGRTYCFSARARSDGVAGAWSAETCTAIPLDDRSLRASSAWKAITGSGFYRSTARRTSSSGATLTRTAIAARRIALVASTCPTCGSVRVYWGGSYRRTISLRSAVAANKVVITILSFSGVRTGTLKLVVGTSGRRVTVDGVAISRH